MHLTGSENLRYPNISALSGKIESAWCHTNHLIVLIIKGKRFADHVGLSPVVALPQTIAEDCDAGRSVFFILICESAADQWRHFEHRKEGGGDHLAAQAFRLVYATTRVEIRRGEVRDPLKGFVRPPKLQIRRRGQFEGAAAWLNGPILHQHQSVGIRIR